MLRDHAPKNWLPALAVRVVDFNSHAARRLAANMIARQVGEGPRCLFLSRFNVRQFYSLFVGGWLVAITDIKKILRPVGLP